jgi:hypothetical protein
MASCVAGIIGMSHHGQPLSFLISVSFKGDGQLVEPYALHTNFSIVPFNTLIATTSSQHSLSLSLTHTHTHTHTQIAQSCVCVFAW